jgi:hypothetical protein
MTALAWLRTLGCDAVFVLVVLGLGEIVLRIAERLLTPSARGSYAAPSATRAGASLLAGFGAASSVGVVVGVLHLFAKPALAAVAVVTLVFSRKTLLLYARWARRAAGTTELLRDPITVLVLLGAVILFAANFQAAVSPPHAWDELVYHLPQAQQIVSSHRLPVTLVSPVPGYGDIPKLVEVLFAEGLVFGGSSLAHVLQMTLFAGFLLYLFGIVRSFYGLRSASLVVLFLLAFDELSYHATVGYVDTTLVVYSVAAVVAFGAAVERRRVDHAAHSALFLGFALAVKYFAAVTLAFLLLGSAVVAIVQRPDARRVASLALRLCLVAFAACGFWYIKNAARFDNPVYPYYFSHAGIDAKTYADVLNSSLGTQSATIANFIRFPKHYGALGSLLTFVSFYTAVFALLVRRAWTFTAVLFAYFLFSFATLFAATRDPRFLWPPAATALILLAITVSGPIARPARLSLIAVAVAALLLGDIGTLRAAPQTFPGTVKEIFRLRMAHYALGQENTDAFLTRWFGCPYETLVYLRRDRKPTRVIDSWPNTPAQSSGEPPAVRNPMAWYYSKHPFVEFTSSSTDPRTVWAQLEKAHARYVFVQGQTKQALLGHAESDPDEPGSRTERLVLTQAQLVFRSGGCALYQIHGLSN